MDRFIRKVLSTEPISRAEEGALARRARAGDLEARGVLITSAMRAVVVRALLLGLRGEELRDAVQSGAVGLIRAVDRFDPDRGVRLATYAWRWIGAEMRRAERFEVSLDGVDVAARSAPANEFDLLDGVSDEGIEVLRLRFGIGDSSAFPLPRAAVAKCLGISESRVRTLEGQAVQRVKKGLAKVLYCVPPQGETNPQ